MAGGGAAGKLKAHALAHELWVKATHRPDPPAHHYWTARRSSVRLSSAQLTGSTSAAVTGRPSDSLPGIHGLRRNAWAAGWHRHHVAAAAGLTERLVSVRDIGVRPDATELLTGKEMIEFADGSVALGDDGEPGEKFRGWGVCVTLGDTKLCGSTGTGNGGKRRRGQGEDIDDHMAGTAATTRSGS